MKRKLAALCFLLAVASSVLPMKLAKDVSACKADKVYHSGKYASNHWAMQPKRLGDPRVIALASYKNSKYTAHLNPTDKRGYRCIVQLIDNKDMSSTFNRDYTIHEQLGLSLFTQLMVNAYTKIVPITQTAMAGNNSHEFNRQTGIIHIGKSEEPSMLHTHIFGRGNPDECYIKDVKLDGPEPGLIFDLRAQTPHEPGNDKKVKWQEGEIEKVANELRSEVNNFKAIYRELGLEVSTSFCDIYLIRHGETDWNTEGRLQGHTDIPLNMSGQKQARTLKEKLAKVNFAAAFSSNLSRARETAQLVLGSRKMAAIEAPQLRERYMGTLEGQPIKDVTKLLQECADFDKLSKEEYLTFKYDNMESYADVYERLKGFIKSVVPSYANSTILLASHGGVLRAVLYALDFRDGFKWQTSNCAFIKLRAYEDGELSIIEADGVQPVKTTTLPF